jgi:hypothetical protein
VILLGAADTLSGGASAATVLTYSIWLMDLTAGPTEAYRQIKGQLAASPAALLTVSGSTTDMVKSISVVNTDTVSRTFQFFSHIAGTGVAAADAITPVFTLAAGAMAQYEDGQGWQFYDSSGNLMTTITSAIGLATVSQVAADVTNSTTTVAAIADLDQVLGPGTYVYTYYIRYQAAATTTGIKFAVDHTGTVTSSTYQMLYVDTSATASTGAADQDANASTAQVNAAYAARADNVTLGPTLSVDTANSDMLIRIEGLIVISASGTLRLMHGSEVAAATTVKIGTSLVVIRTK